jgi:hypothetical protein
LNMGQSPGGTLRVCPFKAGNNAQTVKRAIEVGRTKRRI